ncbi:MAG: 50S ribosomal protein L23 [Rhodospirillales bacterium]
MRNKYAGRAPRPSAARMHNIIRRPLITEKSTMASEHNQVGFEVARDATKPEIRSAVESLFSVKVTAVNTQIRKGKLKRFRGRPGQQKDMKLAMVTLAEGETLDVTTGI